MTGGRGIGVSKGTLRVPVILVAVADFARRRRTEFGVGGVGVVWARLIVVLEVVVVGAAVKRLSVGGVAEGAVGVVVVKSVDVVALGINVEGAVVILLKIVVVVWFVVLLEIGIQESRNAWIVVGVGMRSENLEIGDELLGGGVSKD
jgi:hypothetical protein